MRSKLSWNVYRSRNPCQTLADADRIRLTLLSSFRVSRRLPHDHPMWLYNSDNLGHCKTAC